MSKLYYGIGKIPPGYKAASAKEALAKGEVRRWGQYKINPKLLHGQNVNKMKSVAQNFTNFYKSNYPILKAQGYTDGETDDILVDYWDSHDSTKYTTESMGHLKKSIPIKHVFGEPVMNKTEEIVKLRKELSDLNKAIQTEKQPPSPIYEQETGGWGSTYRNTMEELNEESELYTGKPYRNYENYDIYDVGNERNIEEEQIIDIPYEEYTSEFIFDQPESKELVNLTSEKSGAGYYTKEEWDKLIKMSNTYKNLENDYLRNPYSSPTENLNSYLDYLNIIEIVGINDIKIPKNMTDFSKNREKYISELRESLIDKLEKGKKRTPLIEELKKEEKQITKEEKKPIRVIDRSKILEKYTKGKQNKDIGIYEVINDLKDIKKIKDKKKSYDVAVSIFEYLKVNRKSIPTRENFPKEGNKYIDDILNSINNLLEQQGKK